MTVNVVAQNSTEFGFVSANKSSKYVFLIFLMCAFQDNCFLFVRDFVAENLFTFSKIKNVLEQFKTLRTEWEDWLLND